jgi:tripartite-type tricarboxylate transporter receptor subunit TctC
MAMRRTIEFTPAWPLLLAALTTAVPAIAAEAFPARPLRYVVPAPPGGAPDTLARQTGQRLAETLGQPVVIDNRPGGNGIIGAEIAARAAPDGYTIVMGYAGPFSINPALYPKLSYDPLRDFVPLALIATGQNVLVINRSFTVRSVKDLIALAKAKPGQLNFASGGTGQSSHLSMELLMTMAQIRMVHIPYKGAGPAMADVIGGNVALQFLAVPPAITQIQAGKLIGLGVTGSQRVPALPDVPTIAESGLPGYEVLTWYGAFAPARTPAPIVSRLSRELAAAIGSDDMQQQFRKQGLEAGAVSAEAFGRWLRADVAKWRKVIAEAGITLEP